MFVGVCNNEICTYKDNQQIQKYIIFNNSF